MILTKKNKKGSSIAIAFFILVASLVIIILAGLFIYGYDQIVGGLIDQNVMIGAVNLTNATQDTMGQINNALLDNANIYAVILIFGMFLGMMAAGFLMRAKYPKMLFVVDIFIMIFVYIIAVYLANAYETVLESIPFANYYSTYVSTGSSLVLRLPLISIIAGAITIILSYSTLPKTKEESIAGFN